MIKTSNPASFIAESWWQV